MNLEYYSFLFVVFAIPAALLILCIYSIVKFVKRDKTDMRSTRKYLIIMLISGFLFLAIVAFYIFVCWMLTQMVANM